MLSEGGERIGEEESKEVVFVGNGGKPYNTL